MILFDAHNDLPSKLYASNQAFHDNSHHIDLQRLKQLSEYSFVLCCAIFINERKEKNPFSEGLNVLNAFMQHLHIHSQSVALNSLQKPVAILLSIEGGGVFESNLHNLDLFYQKGVRLVSLTWNDSNALSGGCTEPNKGLTRLGRKFLQKIEEKSIVLDVSHISDRAFDEIFSSFGGKVIASHSNVRNLCHHYRNLTNEQLKKIQKKSGVVGINLYPKFLGNKPQVGIDDVIMHIEYVASMIGIDRVGFGFDFDGVDELPVGIHGIQDVGKIINRLLQLNYSNDEVTKIAGKNSLEIFKDILKI